MKWNVRIQVPRFLRGAPLSESSPAAKPIAGSLKGNRMDVMSREILSPKDRLGRKILEYGLLILLVWAPLPLASVEAWSVLLIEIAALVLFSVYLLLDRKPVLNPRLAADTRFLKPALVGLFVFLVFQILPLPAAIVRMLSPRTAALRASYVPDSARGSVETLSLLPGETLAAILELLAYVLIGYLVIRTVSHRKQMRRIMLTLVAVGVFESLYGMWELTRAHPRLLFSPKTYGLDSVTGTFVNRNHFAGYLEMVIPLALGLIISRLDLFGEPGATFRARLARIVDKGLTQIVLLGAGLVVMSVALLLSNSRSGAAVLILSFILMSALAAHHFGQNLFHQAWIRRVVRIAFVLILIFGLYIGLEQMVGRFDVDKLLQDGRPRYWGTVLTMIGQFPLFGVGYGAFGGVYQAFDTAEMEYALVHAHNDYLEHLVELGLIGFGLLVFIIGWMLVKSFRTWSVRRHPEVKGLALGGLVSAAAIALHSLTDFNLQIPANKLTFAVVLALTLKTAYHRKT
ncbi:MAG: O-antigen ligase family protein [Candidatus Aminicenantes bacterium]|nr:O-antigen ligase family protein [Candidatus Aminicenantes bacterium]